MNLEIFKRHPVLKGDGVQGSSGSVPFFLLFSGELYRLGILRFRNSPGFSLCGKLIKILTDFGDILRHPGKGLYRIVKSFVFFEGLSPCRRFSSGHEALVISSELTNFETYQFKGRNELPLFELRPKAFNLINGIDNRASSLIEFLLYTIREIAFLDLLIEFAHSLLIPRKSGALTGIALFFKRLLIPLRELLGDLGTLGSEGVLLRPPIDQLQKVILGRTVEQGFKTAANTLRQSSLGFLIILLDAFGNRRRSVLYRTSRAVRLFRKLGEGSRVFAYPVGTFRQVVSQHVVGGICCRKSRGNEKNRMGFKQVENRNKTAYGLCCGSYSRLKRQDIRADSREDFKRRGNRPEHEELCPKFGNGRNKIRKRLKRVSDITNSLSAPLSVDESFLEFKPRITDAIQLCL